MKAIFAGTPEFARVALQSLWDAGFDISLVLTQPDRPAGRGMKLQASPVKAFASAHGIPVSQPRSLRLDGKYPDDARSAQQALAAAGADVMVVAAYGLILPQWVLDLPRLGCLNIHASLLPRWRGAAPIHRCIEAGDTSTGVTIMQMDAGLDTGAMLLAEAVPILDTDTTGSLHDRLAALGGRLIVDVLRRADPPGDKRLQAVPQPAEGVTYAHKIEKHEAAVDWRQPAAAIARRVRAFDPFPGATTLLDGEVLKIWSARARPAASGAAEPAAAPGTVLGVDVAAVQIATGDGVLELLALQRAGGRRLSTAEFLRGFDLQAGMTFEPQPVTPDGVS